MKRKFHRIELRAGLLAMCALASLYAGPGAAQDISLERGKDHVPVARVFDPSKNETTVSVVPDSMGGLAARLLSNSPDVQSSPTHQTVEFTMRAVSYSYPGNIPLRPQHVNFVFISDGRKPKYKDNLDFSIDADASPLHQGKIDYSVKDSTLGRIEVLLASVPTEVFLRIAQAKKVQWTLGPKKYKLTDSQRKDMRALAETIP
jgi:hypothetical protein